MGGELPVDGVDPFRQIECCWESCHVTKQFIAYTLPVFFAEFASEQEV